MSSEAPSNPDHDRSKLGKVFDPTIRVKIGKKLNQYLQSRTDLYSKVPAIFTIPQIKSLLKSINEDKKTKNCKSSHISLYDLMKDSEILLPSLEVPTRDPELDKRVNKLRNQLAEKEYQRMTKNVNFTSRFNPEDSIGAELRKMNTGLIAVFQFLITVGAAFAFGFMGLEVFLGYTFELPVKLLLGIIFSLVVGAAELYFLVINMDLGDAEDDGPAVNKNKVRLDVTTTTQTKKTN